MTSAGYLRFPHVHGDLIVFIADDDVWLAPAEGGRAWRISADHAAASYPRISRDGTTIAWTSERDGPPEVYLAGMDGGNGRRLSYWGDRRTRVCGWTPDGNVVATTAAGQPFDHFTWAYAVAVGEPGEPPAAPAGRPLPFGPVRDLAIEAGGVALLNGTFRSDPAFWKRYRGGTSGRLWLRPAPAPGGPTPANRFTRVLGDLAGQFSSPMLIGDRLAFLSDHDGRPDRGWRRPASDSPAKDSPAERGPGQAGSAESGPVSRDRTAAQAGPREAAREPVRVDTAGLASRIVQLPVAESRYASLRAVTGGLAWLRVQVTGNLGEGGASPGDAAPRPPRCSSARQPSP